MCHGSAPDSWEKEPETYLHPSSSPDVTVPEMPGNAVATSFPACTRNRHKDGRDGKTGGLDDTPSH